MQESLDLCEGTERFPIYLHDSQRAKILKTFKYVPCNIPGPGTSHEDFESVLAGCDCMDCPCVVRFGPNYDHGGRILPQLLCPDSSKPVVECNTNCSCPPHCSNRLVQNGIHYRLNVFETNTKGFGLCTQEHIPAYSFVCEYAGEVLTEQEASERVRRKTLHDMNYVFVLQEFCAGGLVKTIVDPEVIGNVGRFINHSCEPNLVMVPVRVSHSVPRLALFACRDIVPAEELCYDYSGRSSGTRTSINNDTVSGSRSSNTSTSNVTSTGQALWEGKRENKICYCGTAKCCRVLPFDETLFR